MKLPPNQAAVELSKGSGLAEVHFSYLLDREFREQRKCACSCSAGFSCAPRCELRPPHDVALRPLRHAAGTSFCRLTELFRWSFCTTLATKLVHF
jgi:hypothetical protein